MIHPDCSEGINRAPGGRERWDPDFSAVSAVCRGWIGCAGSDWESDTRLAKDRSDLCRREKNARALGCVRPVAWFSTIYWAGPARSAMTASSVNFAAVTPMRSKHSATMLFEAVSNVMRRSIGVIERRSWSRAR